MQPGGIASPALVSFCVYNPDFGPREGEEHKKILYYYPSEVNIDDKIRSVGLCEAIVQFTRTFCTEEPAQALHTQTNRQLFLEAEENFWMVMVVSNPTLEKQEKDGPRTREYQEEELLDNVYKAVLQQSYSMYKLFKGTFETALAAGGVETLKRRLHEFFSRYLPTLRLAQCDLLDALGGITFFPLDKMTYLKVQSFVNRVEAALSAVSCTAFLYHEQLVWSGLEQEDMRILYKYLTTSLFPSTVEAELAGKESPIRSGSPTNPQHYGRFLLGPSSLAEPGGSVRVPRIFVTTNTAPQELHLIVYKALSAAMCFMVDASVDLTIDYFRELDRLVGPQLTLLASDIAEQFTVNRRAASDKEPQFKFIYFNRMNLAEKTTLHGRRAAHAVAPANAPPELMRILGDVHGDFTRASEDEEVVVKAMSDYWVVGKKSDQRELYIILSQKNANLIEVNEEVKKLSVTHFSNIFFLD
ncbi:unnamed protein product [Lampetra fluviatilis]